MDAMCTRIWWVRPVSMRTSRNANFSERGGDTLTNFVVRHRGTASPAAWCNIPRTAVDWVVAIFGWPAMNQSYIKLLHLTAGELLGQLTMRRVVLGHQDQAAVLVETMHDSRPQLAANFRQLAKPMQQRIDQRPAVASG